MMKLFHITLPFYTTFLISSSIFSSNASLVFIVNDEHYSTKSDTLTKQIKEEYSDEAKVYTATKDFLGVHSWVYFPIFERLLLQNENATWFVFLEERTNFTRSKLASALKLYNHSKEFFIGKGLRDVNPTIIHHFDLVDKSDPLLYPDIRAGFALSRPLLKRLCDVWSPDNGPDFSIDSPYELTKFIKTLSIKLRHDKYFCIQPKEGCATWFSLLRRCEQVPQKISSDIHIAVKTCSKLANERLPILKETWLKNIPSFGLYSDLEDKKLGTISIGIPNTDHGHCGKTLGIIRHTSRKPKLKWLVIVDDDTILSIERLMSFLNCYDPSLRIAAGQRYGFRTISAMGFDYLTGGSGMIFSSEVVSLLSQENICSCPSIDSPDDMVIGSCLKRINVPLVHSSRFHQARPEDYSADLLMGTKPISFHKFWIIDPVKEYKEWLVDGKNQRTKEEL